MPVSLIKKTIFCEKLTKLFAHSLLMDRTILCPSSDIMMRVLFACCKDILIKMSGRVAWHIVCPKWQPSFIKTRLM